MLRSLYSGVSGLNRNIVRLDVIGNNIANVNTVGFKGSRVSFGDSFSQTLQGGAGPGANRGGVNPIQVGSGVRVNAITTNFGQGNIQTTGNANDLAIQGEGLFVVSNGEEQFYTRAGTFTVDAYGRITHSGSGNIVQGYSYNNEAGRYDSALGELIIPFNQTDPARATEELVLQGNFTLDSEALATVLLSGKMADAITGDAMTSATLLTDLRTPGGTEQLLFDGDTISLEAIVGETDINQTFAVGAGATVADFLAFIETELSLPAGNASVDEDGGIRVEGDPDLGISGAINFLSLTAEDGVGSERSLFNVSTSFSQEQIARDAGEIVQETVVYDSLGESHALRLTFTRVTDELAWTWQAELDGRDDLIVSGGSGGATFFSDGTLATFTFDGGVSEVTFDPDTGASAPQSVRIDYGQLGSPEGLTSLAGSTTLESTQDGYTTGHFVDYAIDGSGTIHTLYSNGVTHIVGDLAMALFNNPTALTKSGQALYRVSSNSGEPSIRSVSEIPGTSVIMGALEQSNVDLANEFSDMIVTQRAFQASARIIQTSSEILADLMNLSR